MRYAGWVTPHLSTHGTLSLVCQLDSSESSTQQLDLPSSVSIQPPLSYSHQSSTLHIKANLSESMVSDPSETPVLEDIRLLTCSQCEQVLTRMGNTVHVKPMPSPYWQELIDCWACHAEDYLDKFSQSKESHIQQGIVLPRPDCLLVDQESWLVHPDHVTSSAYTRCAVAMNVYESLNKWKPIQCDRCAHPLGHVYIQRDTPLALKWYKASVHAYTLQSVLPRPSFPSLFAQHLIQLSRAHATHRVLLYDESADPDLRLVVWLWNPSVHLFTSTRLDCPSSPCTPLVQASLGSVSPHQVTQGMRVLFLQPSDLLMDDTLDSMWSGDKSGVERLYYPMEFILELVLILTSSQLLLPVSERSMMLSHPMDEKWQQEFQVGFLPFKELES